VAGRPKDLEFTRELAQLKMIKRSTLKQRLKKTELSRPERSRNKSRIDANIGGGDRNGKRLVFEEVKMLELLHLFYQ
jgi:hypothetical protein